MDRKKHLHGKKDVGRKKHLDSKERLDCKTHVELKKHLDSKERLDCKTHVELAIGLAHSNMVVGRMASEIGPTRIHGIFRVKIGGLGSDVSGAAAAAAGVGVGIHARED